MSERKYSVAEIDDMRDTIRWWGFPNGGNVRDIERETEDRLRTYMLNGTDPDELKRTLQGESYPSTTVRFATR